MPPTRSLFERLRRVPTSASIGHVTTHDLDDLRRSVIANLERILNSREGMSLGCASYGLPDLTQIVNGVPERAREIEQSIERCIKMYEPRLSQSQIEVEHVPNAHGPMTACFRIRASVHAGKSAEEVWFETVVVSSGRVKLT
jgi:type VI secretion system protein